MKTDRKWIVLAALTTLLLMIGCSGNKKKVVPPTPPPPAPVERAPATDVSSTAQPAGPVDEQEPETPKSIQEIQSEAERLGLLGDVYFDFDQSDLRPEARERLARNAEYMNSESGRNLTFVLEGHCDERGTNEYNLALGQSRSTVALDYLTSLGVDRSRLKTISYGEERPFCTESTEACWQKNRRSHFMISGTR